MRRKTLVRENTARLAELAGVNSRILEVLERMAEHARNLRRWHPEMPTTDVARYTGLSYRGARNILRLAGLPTGRRRRAA